MTTAARRRRRRPVLGAALAAVFMSLAGAQGVRVVDSVIVATPADEAAHEFEGQDTNTGVSGGLRWRSATGWFSYSLRIYDDAPLTLACLLADGQGGSERFDVLVDGKKVATVSREPTEAKGAELRFNLKLADTEGKTSVVVKLAAHPRSRTGRLLEIRTLQEHLE
jgi:hypothetical protein